MHLVSQAFLELLEYQVSKANGDLQGIRILSLVYMETRDSQVFQDL